MFTFSNFYHIRIIINMDSEITIFRIEMCKKAINCPPIFYFKPIQMTFPFMIGTGFALGNDPLAFVIKNNFLQRVGIIMRFNHSNWLLGSFLRLHFFKKTPQCFFSLMVSIASAVFSLLLKEIKYLQARWAYLSSFFNECFIF